MFGLAKKRFGGHKVAPFIYGKEGDRKTELVWFLRLQRVGPEPRDSNYNELPMKH